MLQRCALASILLLGCSSNARPGVLDSAVAVDASDVAASPDQPTPDVVSDAAAPLDVVSAPDVVSDAAAPLDVVSAPDVSDAAAPLDVVSAPDVSDVPSLDAAHADGAPADALHAGGMWVAIPGGERCNARERQVPTQASPHVDEDAGAIAWLTNPPSSGPHFNSWTRFGSFPNLQRGNWVHNLEHGGVAFLYRCAGDAGGCDSERDALIAAAAMIPGDPACAPDSGLPRLRVVITNDALIETPIAGAAWGWLYSADCVEASSVRSFFTRHVGQAPEDFCADGFIP